MYDKCNTCKHKDSEGKPSYSNMNCTTCITRGNHLGYERDENTHNDIDNRYYKLIIWLCLIIVHICFVVACLALGLHISIFKINFIWFLLAALIAALIDAGFAYIMYLLIAPKDNHKKR